MKVDRPFERAVACYEAGDLTGALTIYEGLGEAPQALKNKGVILRQSGRFAAAEAAFGCVVTQHKDSISIEVLIGQVFPDVPLLMKWKAANCSGHTGYRDTH